MFLLQIYRPKMCRAFQTQRISRLKTIFIGKGVLGDRLSVKSCGRSTSLRLSNSQAIHDKLKPHVGNRVINLEKTANQSSMSRLQKHHDNQVKHFGAK